MSSLMDFVKHIDAFLNRAFPRSWTTHCHSFITWLSVLPHSTEFLQLDNQHQQSQHDEHQTAPSQIPQNQTDEQIPDKKEKDL